MEQPRVLKKRDLIRDHVAGLSFVDIGGLWGTTGETVTTAVLAGASRSVMADIRPLGSSWWQNFEAHCTERGVEGYEELQVDICAANTPEILERFDFVHCSGVMYHVADLFQFVGNLVAVTGKYLLLSSVVMPDEIRARSGSMSFGPDHAYLAPILSAENQQVIAEYLEEKGIRAGGVTHPAEFLNAGRPISVPLSASKWGPWWWLFSSGFMTRIVGMYGLEILAEGTTPMGNGYTVFARVSDD